MQFYSSLVGGAYYWDLSFQMDRWTSQDDAVTMLDSTPVYSEADYPELMRDELWTHVDCSHFSKVNESALHGGDAI
ncbi:unnamed protein product [Hydatigera taeniaeformis]|uniref:Uncharacterized protein n=1 Tax=Hydatigena taeniaeformis TaxID=6205 RepID=A0A0R3WVB7_HYDTA|nr:unnamed protein product [Hydatigera taeniaeformis]